MLDPTPGANEAQTDGYVSHTGRIRLSRKLATGALVTVTLPDDWKALVDRVTALEAALGGVNSLEDLTYGG